MKLLLIFLFGIASSFTFAQKVQQKNDYLISYSVKQDIGALFGYKHRNGKIAIEAQFSSINTDTLYNMGIVLKDWQWVGIDRKEKVILIPFIYDNGPDYVEEGLFRFVENVKIGFADLDGNKIIPAQYSFATFFKDGIADYYIGGDRIYENGKSRKQNIEDGTLRDGDVHWTWGGNVTENGYLNQFGQRFKEVGEFKNGRREALTVDGNKVWLDKAGKIIKR